MSLYEESSGSGEEQLNSLDTGAWKGVGEYYPITSYGNGILKALRVA